MFPFFLSTAAQGERRQSDKRIFYWESCTSLNGTSSYTLTVKRGHCTYHILCVVCLSTAPAVFRRILGVSCSPCQGCYWARSVGRNSWVLEGWRIKSYVHLLKVINILGNLNELRTYVDSTTPISKKVPSLMVENSFWSFIYTYCCLACHLAL